MVNFAYKVNLRRGDKRVLLLHLSSYYTPENIEKLHGSNKFKISETTWDETFKLPDRSYYISDMF